MMYRHPQGRKIDYWGGGRSGKKHPTRQKSIAVGRLSSLTVPSPGWPWQGGVFQLPTGVSHTHSPPAAALESRTRISRQAMDAAGLQRGKSAAALGLVTAAARNGLW